MKDLFWDSIKIYFTLVGVALTAFLSVGAVYLALWINDWFGAIIIIILLFLLILGGGSILEENGKEKEK